MSLLADIPRFAFGTAFAIGSGGTSEQDFLLLLQRAFEMGCRHIDCAPLYGTQRLVGEAIKRVGRHISRRDLFITSKLPVNMMGEENILRSVRKTLDSLELSYLDLFLIHAPFATQHVADDIINPVDDEGNLLLDNGEKVLENAWKGLADLQRNGLVRYVGLSNVNRNQLIRLNKIHHVDVLQNEFHLYHQDRDLIECCQMMGIHFEAYAALGSPLKVGLENKPTFLTEPLVDRLANEKGISKAQVVIQWLLKQPLSFVLRSDDARQLEENMTAKDTTALSEGDIMELNLLDRKERVFLYTNHKGIEKHREYPFGIAEG